MANLRVGDIVIFKGGGFAFAFLGTILKWFEPWWDKFGWHLAFVAHINSDDKVFIAEAQAKGVCLTDLATCEGEYRIYRWFDTPLYQRPVMEFVNHHKGDRYDVLCYFWSFIQRLALRLFKWKLGYLKNDDYTCWEWVAYFCEKFGKPWCDELNFPLITDFLKQNPRRIL